MVIIKLHLNLSYQDISSWFGERLIAFINRRSGLALCTFKALDKMVKLRKSSINVFFGLVHVDSF